MWASSSSGQAYAPSWHESEDIEDSYILFRSCESECDDHGARPYIITDERQVEYAAPYPPGRYIVRFERPADKPGVMTFGLKVWCE